MKHVPTVAGALLGLLFVAFGLMFLLDLVGDQPPPPAGSYQEHFFAALAPTGYLTFVKLCEVLGGVLVAVPRTRCVGMLLLGPIVVNIVAFHVLVAGDGIADPILLGVLALSVVVVLGDLRRWLALLRPPAAA